MTIFDEVPKEVLLTELQAEVRKIYAQRQQFADMGQPFPDLGSSVIAMARTAEQCGYLGTVRAIYDTTERLFERQ
jgi:hypothetical protein